MQNYCQVCFMQLNPKFTTKLSQVLECTNCSIKVHRYCYQPNICHKDNFLCDMCLHPPQNIQKDKQKNQKSKSKGKKKGSKKKEEPTKKSRLCFICGNDGLLKFVNEKIWGHPICLLTSHEIFVKSYQSLQFDYLIEPKNKRKKTRCQICLGQTSETIKCFDSSCHNSAHLYCILKQNTNDNDAAKWIQDIRMLGSHFNQIQIFWAHVKKQVKAENLQIYKAIWGSQVLNLNQPLRIVHCPAHQLNLVNCKCISDSPSLSQTDWIGCDGCQQWYHFQCENVFKPQCLGQAYKCLQCKQWHKVLEQNQRPVLKIFPKMYIYDFVYIHYYAQVSKFKDKDLLINIIAKNPFLPSLELLSEYKYSEIDTNIMKTIKLDSIQKYLQKTEITQLSKNISTKKRQITSNINKLKIVQADDFLQILKMINSKQVWTYSKLLQACNKISKKFKNNKVLKNIISLLNQIQGQTPQKMKEQEQNQQNNQIFQGIASLKDAMSWLNYEKGSNQLNNLLNFFKLISQSSILMKNIKVNVIQANRSKWRIFSGLFQDYSLQEIVKHAILAYLCKQFQKKRRNKALNINILQRINNNFLQIFESTTSKVKRNFIKNYYEIYSDYFNKDYLHDNQPNFIFQVSYHQNKSVFLYPVNFSQKDKCLERLPENQEEQTGQKCGMEIQQLNSQISYHKFYTQPLKTFNFPSKINCMYMSRELKHQLLHERFKTIISTIPLTKNSQAFINRQYQNIQKKDSQTGQLVEKLYKSYCEFYRLCQQLIAQISSQKYQYSISFENEDRTLVCEIKQTKISFKNYESFTKFFINIFQAQVFTYLHTNIKSELCHKSIQYVQYLYHRENFIQNKDQFQAVKQILKLFQNDLIAQQNCKKIIAEFKQLYYLFMEAIDVLYNTQLNDLQNPQQICQKVKLLQKVFTNSKAKNLQFLNDHLFLRLKNHQLYQQALQSLPTCIFNFVPNSLIQKAPKSIDIQVLRYFLKKMQLTCYPTDTILYRKLNQLYTNAAIQYEFFVGVIKQYNKKFCQNLMISYSRKYNAKQLRKLCKRQRIVEFQPETLQIEYICQEYQQRIQQKMRIIQQVNHVQEQHVLDFQNFIKDNIFQPDHQILDFLNTAKQSFYNRKPHICQQLRSLYNRLQDRKHQVTLEQCQQFMQAINKKDLQNKDIQLFNFILFQIKNGQRIADEIIQHQDLSQVKDRITIGMRPNKNKDFLNDLQDKYRNCLLKIPSVQSVLDTSKSQVYQIPAPKKKNRKFR